MTSMPGSPFFVLIGGKEILEGFGLQDVHVPSDGGEFGLEEEQIHRGARGSGI